MTAVIISAKNISRGLGFKSGVWLTATYGQSLLFIKRAKDHSTVWITSKRMWRDRVIWVNWLETVKWMTCSVSPVSCYLVRPTCVLVDHPVRAAPRARAQTHTWPDETPQTPPQKSTTEYWPSQSTRIGYKEPNWEWSQWMQRSSQWRRWRGWVDCSYCMAKLTHRKTITCQSLNHLCMRLVTYSL